MSFFLKELNLCHDVRVFPKLEKLYETIEWLFKAIFVRK